MCSVVGVANVSRRDNNTKENRSWPWATLATWDSIDLLLPTTYLSVHSYLNGITNKHDRDYPDINDNDTMMVLQSPKEPLAIIKIRSTKGNKRNRQRHNRLVSFTEATCTSNLECCQCLITTPCEDSTRVVSTIRIPSVSFPSLSPSPSRLSTDAGTSYNLDRK